MNRVYNFAPGPSMLPLEVLDFPLGWTKQTCGFKSKGTTSLPTSFANFINNKHLKLL